AHVECHPDRRAPHERVQRRREPPFSKDGRVDTSGVLAQLVERARQAGGNLVEFSGERVELGWDLGLSRPYLERERDEPLLRAVVQVTLDAAPGLVGGGDDA